jgi:hypothetical protein
MGAAAGGVVFDRSRYPVVILRMPVEGSVEDVHAWYDEVERLLGAASEPIALLHDLRPLALSTVTALHRAAVAKRTLALRDAPHLCARIGADGRIVGNAIVAGAVTVVTWLTGATPWPQGTFSDEEKAVAWCEEQLTRRARAAG